MSKSRLVFSALLSSALLISSASQATAHGFVHEQIETLTAQLRNRPNDATLLTRRAELLLTHEEPKAARADLLAALAADPEQPAALLILARLERESQQLLAAHQAIDAYLAKVPTDPIALREKALIHAAAEQWESAVAAWELHLKSSPQPGVEPFIACAEALIHQDANRKALEVLNAGIEKHPRVIPLRQRAASVLIELGEDAEARRHLVAILESYPTLRPRLFVEEAALWQGHARPVESLAAYRDARAAFELLPQSRRLSPGFRALDQRIEEGLASLNHSVGDLP